MTARWLRLYLRSRRVPLAASISLTVVAVVMLLQVAWSDRPQVDRGLAVLTGVLALSPLIPTLAGDDDALEGTAALPWPPRRVLHLIAAAAFVAVLLLGARAAGIDFGSPWQILRNSAGLAGLIGLGVALLGARLAWIIPVAWSAQQAMMATAGGPHWRQSLLWLIQPRDNVPAAITAAALLLAGVLAYASRAGPPTPPNEAEMGR